MPAPRRGGGGFETPGRYPCNAFPVTRNLAASTRLRFDRNKEMAMASRSDGSKSALALAIAAGAAAAGALALSAYSSSKIRKEVGPGQPETSAPKKISRGSAPFSYFMLGAP